MIAQWPDILEFYEGIEDKSQMNFDVAGMSIPMPNDLLRSQETFLSAGFTCAIVSSVIGFIAVLIGACIISSSPKQEILTPDIVYVAPPVAVADALKKY